jgi:hypothetical protein
MTRPIAVLFCSLWLMCVWCYRAVLRVGGLTVRGYCWVASRYRRSARPKEPRNHHRPTGAPRRRSIAWFPD